MMISSELQNKLKTLIDTICFLYFYFDKRNSVSLRASVQLKAYTNTY
ncbi:hypothetical protein AS52_01734 [Priestia megaterium Q3]|uniref:Uncharacterized protein n=1 Tax=Priestia megaterium Q3 TaxID=1452722 RepID=A0A806TPY3_PRIMG|nr:hypothetical protein AS52_01734 [Priestia megaterium Q3]